MENQKYPFPTKPKLNKASIPVILWNLFPFIGVLFLGWKPESVFICYALETVVVGIFNVFKLVAVYYYGLPPGPNESGVSGLGIIPFFIVHYYFFVFIQLSIFFSGVDTGSHLLGQFGFVFTLLNQGTYQTALAIFVISCAGNFVTDFILNGKYTQRTMGEQMFEPYPRIFVQQFVVIIGGFIFTVTDNGYPVLIVFVAIKIYLDLLFKDFDISSFNKTAIKKVDNSI